MSNRQERKQNKTWRLEQRIAQWAKIINNDLSSEASKLVDSCRVTNLKLQRGKNIPGVPRSYRP